ncbi:MAG: anhydro-N-acetylmuramic acid kinase, partial [Pseudobdellovibrionaceae bacterium]
DGYGFVERIGFYEQVYEEAFRNRVKAQFKQVQRTPEISAVEQELTEIHALAVKNLLAKYGNPHVDFIGFHGQTITHEPENGFTWQIGDGPLLARETGIDVVCDFRSADVAAGGQGAPLIPLYHKALAEAAGLKKPCAILNIGGVANVTFIGEGENDILAFDTGPGNALMDDFILERLGVPYDKDGRLAAEGVENKDCIDAFLRAAYFDAVPPKSLDRGAWHPEVSLLSNEDGMATLQGCTRESIIKATQHFSAPAKAWYVCGGGRKNASLMKGLRDRLGVPVEPVDTLGWDGDALEAEGFAYLAVRSHLGLPLSLPSTTGVKAPQTGGVYHKAGKDGPLV